MSTTTRMSRTTRTTIMSIKTTPLHLEWSQKICVAAVNKNNQQQKGKKSKNGPTNNKN